MASDENSANSDQGSQQPGKTRTWWHPLLVRLLDHLLATAYTVLYEVLVGKMPLRVDIVLIRREQGHLSAAAASDLGVLARLLNRFTLLEFKGPTDTLQPGDLAQLIGCAFLWHSQQKDGVFHDQMTLVILATRLNDAFREDLRLLGWRADQREPGVYAIGGAPWTTWLVETDVMANLNQPVLSLVSHVFLDEHERIIDKLKAAGRTPLLCYMLQQIQQFRMLDKGFAMQHTETEYLGELEEDLKTAVLEAIPTEDLLRVLTPDDLLRVLTPDDLLRGLTLEDRLRGLAPEDRLRGLAPEDRLRGLTADELTRLRRILAQRQDA